MSMMNILVLKRDDPEATSREKTEYYVGMFLSKGQFDFGLKRTQIRRLHYEPGTLFITPRFHPMFVRAIDAHYMMVNVSDTALNLDDDRGAEVHVRSQMQLEDRRIQGLMMALSAERRVGFPSGTTFLDSIEMALASVLRQGHASELTHVQQFQGGLTPLRLRRAMEFIHANLHRDMTLREIADAVGLSVSHFSHMFRSSTSLSPHQFIVQLRVKRASELLRTSNSRILDVATACGFKTQQHFARLFRRGLGVNPTEYRNSFGSAIRVDELPEKEPHLFE
jgi:AraC family transcriptional regulator